MIGERLSKDWQLIGRLISLRLKKSGIEYVILAGSSIFRCQGRNPGFGRSWLVVVARAARDFFNDFDFEHLKSEIFAGPQGHLAGLGSELSNYWKKSWD